MTWFVFVWLSLVHMHGIIRRRHGVHLKSDDQGQGAGRVSDVDGQVVWEGGGGLEN